MKKLEIVMRDLERPVITAYGRDSAMASTIIYRDTVTGKVKPQN